MGPLDPIVQTIALTMGVGWASGINLYATVCMLGILGASGNIVLPPGLIILTHPLVLGVAGILYAIEFIVDKTPGADTGWDGIHTFIRIPMGALLAAGAVGEVSPPLAVAAALVGGSLAAGTHATKAGSRVLINTSPEPFSNWIASLVEDAAVIAGLWAALHHPALFLGLLFVFILVMIWLLPKIWHGVKMIFAALTRFFSKSTPPTIGVKGEPR